MVNYYYGCYDPLQYPLLFPFGKNGWHCGIQKVEPLGAFSSRQKYCENEQISSITNMTTIDGFLDIEAEDMQKGKRKRNSVSCRECYCYQLQMRDDENIILHLGRLFQQYIIDQWIKTETQRLDFSSFNPDLYRTYVLGGDF